MTCYHPRKVWEGRRPTVNGKMKIVFVSEKAKDVSDWFTVPCTQCVGCRADSAIEKAFRGHHEASLYRDNCFVTLTYADESLPWGSGLKKSDHQKFVKQLRNYVERKGDGRQVRYMMCGEYGDLRQRPHYHFLLFNWDFKDKRVTRTRGGYPVYESKLLSKLWPHGLHEIGEAGFESSAYIGRYISKKLNGKLADRLDPNTGLKYYERVDVRTGEIIEVIPEYYACSTKPGIGAGWYEKFESDCWPDDFLVHKGRKLKVPAYYLDLLERANPQLHQEIRQRRAENAPTREDYLWGEYSPERLEARKQCHKARLRLGSSRDLGGDA